MTNIHESIEQYIHALKQETALKSIRITASIPDDIKVTDSKFGGIPYLPMNVEQPKNEAGDYLTFMAQYRLDELSQGVIDLPEKGMLQFWYLNDDVYGLEYEGDHNDNFCVIYYETIDEALIDSDVISRIQTNDDDNKYPPIIGTFKLSFDVETVYLDHTNYRYDQFASKHAIEANDLYYETIEKVINNDGHRIGGYPFFTQADPRDNKKYMYHTKLLLQIDIEDGDFKTNNIMFGDSGVANVFITETDLARRDFSNVLYHWDCC